MSGAVGSARVAKSVVAEFLFCWAVSVRPRARWRGEPAARCSAPSRMTMVPISPRTNPRHEPTTTHAPATQTTGHQRSFDLCLRWDARGIGWRVRHLAPSHPFLFLCATLLISFIFDGWLVSRRRSTHPSCLAKSPNTLSPGGYTRCRVVVCFNVLFQCDRSARHNPCLHPRRIVECLLD